MRAGSFREGKYHRFHFFGGDVFCVSFTTFFKAGSSKVTDETAVPSSLLYTHLSG